MSEPSGDAWRWRSLDAQEALTPGQIRVRELLTAKRQGYVSSSDVPLELANEVRDAFRSDPVVRSDRATGARVDHGTYAAGYVDYLRTCATTSRTSNRCVPLEAFILIRTDLSERGGFAYMLGPKWLSTVRALFGLLEGKTLPSLGWDLSVYCSDGPSITMNASGGCHRTLAHYLAGVPTVGTEAITVYTSSRPADPILNDALLFLESRVSTVLRGEEEVEQAVLKALHTSTVREGRASSPTSSSRSRTATLPENDRIVLDVEETGSGAQNDGRASSAFRKRHASGSSTPFSSSSSTAPAVSPSTSS